MKTWGSAKVVFVPLRRIVLVPVGALAVLLLLLMGGNALHAARPSLNWAWNPVTNELRLTASPGSGPLGLWVWDRTDWSGSGQPVAREPIRSEELRPGEHFRATVGLAGPDAVHERVRLNVPDRPTFHLRSISDRQIEIASSQPLLAVTGVPAGAGVFTRSDPADVVLDRQVETHTYRLRVQAQSGEIADWSVTVPALPRAPIVWFGSPAGGQVYLTIDDGWFPNQRLLQIMQTEHVPVTAFLIERAALEHLNYWRAFVAAGGEIEDHTLSHPDLTTLSLSEAETQWKDPVDAYPQLFSVPVPTLGRPPYGAIDATVQAAAREAGLADIVMWDVEWVPGNGFKTWNGRPIQAGDIILLHWVPGVGKAFESLLSELDKEHLHPALLTQGSL